MAIDKDKSLEGRIRIGATIQNVREQKQLTCDDLGQMIGVTRQTISKIENGRYSAGADTLWLIAEALGCEWILKQRK